MRMILAQFDKMNCGGFAFGVTQWVNVTKNSGSYRLLARSPSNLYPLACDMKRYVPVEYRIITARELVAPDEYRVAFRMGKNDFHFMREVPSGVWVDKRGNESFIEAHSEKYVLNAMNWYEDYGGRTVLLAVKKGADYDEWISEIEECLDKHDGNIEDMMFVRGL